MNRRDALFAIAATSVASGFLCSALPVKSEAQCFHWSEVTVLIDGVELTPFTEIDTYVSAGQTWTPEEFWANS